MEDFLVLFLRQQISCAVHFLSDMFHAEDEKKSGREDLINTRTELAEEAVTGHQLRHVYVVINAAVASNSPKSSPEANSSDHLFSRIHYPS